MIAEIISIGDELLIGQVVNTNASWIAEQLNLAGIEVQQITTISDKREQILKILARAYLRSDIILITGGLGPTKDDITKQTLCEFFNTSLVFNNEAYEQIYELFKARGFKVTELNRQQAELPANCIPLKNKNGTAPGMWFNKDGKIFVSMPGVPFEMKPMITEQVIPRLRKFYKTGFIIHKTILTQGIGESFLTEIISDWEKNLPENFSLAYLPQPGIVRLRITAKGNNKEKLIQEINSFSGKLQEIIPDLIFGYEKDTLEEITGKLLKDKNQTLSTAESCTGGYISHLITSVPGSSNYYIGSVIAYSNQIKESLLGVKNKTLIDNGAVSKQVVTEMALGVQQKFKTDYAIATSGIAGPDGGTEKKPVGTTWIAIATPGKKVIAKKYLFGEQRGRNIRKAALTALNMLRKELIT
ncbi:MAG: competence/damage-inducible protein A [Bacteroidetes bacterium]|jgi:nicotinamide-nucleotide amidase|nr:competence/damage-inducible protein A [Bacteroidota bacterium]MCK4288414.1 competence/damage-inducible protein A [Bacteroidales bacterium]